MNAIMSYSTPALHHAAKFIWDNNPYAHNFATSVLDIMTLIQSDMRSTATKNAKILLDNINTNSGLESLVTFCGTAGYYLVFTDWNVLDQTINIHIDILVEPSVGRNSHFANEALDIDNISV